MRLLLKLENRESVTKLNFYFRIFKSISESVRYKMVTTLELLISKVTLKSCEIGFRGKRAYIIGKLGTQNREIKKYTILNYDINDKRF